MMIKVRNIRHIQKTTSNLFYTQCGNICKGAIEFLFIEDVYPTNIILGIDENKVYFLESNVENL